MLFSYNNKNQNHTENTFSHLPNKYIISSLNSETQIKPRKKKNHNLVKLREEGREGGRSVLGCDDRDRGRQIWVHDRGRRIGAATAIAIGAKAKSNGEVEGWSRMVTSNGEVEGCDLKSNNFALWVRSLSGCDLSGRSLAGRRGVLSPSLFFLYLTLTQLSLSLSVFRKIVFEGKIKTEINLHPTHGQLKTISEKCIFHAQPNTRKYEKHFRKWFSPKTNTA